ncbi:ABC transporter ATP-binding protein [Lipingzhangella sp. LS1_29]|uniref:ABC transporter ATP-binding protein n=1 Tax=Lipingzhangella rawalii TaxID=2055835 RepID=A0ABU2HAE5_9ACTN|nr:ABC transporter ATP-binding protein [Lipingzhangella rawalii]MDS1272236.1 ABC transporter ATP-binding protein [Lipingzhangella rawalii]
MTEHTPTAAPAVEVRGLHKRYGATAAVDGVDLDLARGEVLSLLGPNGAGKSTTLEIIAGFRSRDRGTVQVLGSDPKTAGRAWRARIGIVWQRAVEDSPLTVREVVRHFAGYYPDPRPTDEVLELVGLDRQARTRVRALSGGQRRRLDVALGIVGRPELLFLDEPTTGFDPQARHAFWELLRQLAADQTSILLTTHYLHEAEALADRVVVLADGRVVADGDPATLGGQVDARTVVSWYADGEDQQVRTDQPTQFLRQLLDTHPGEIPQLSVHRPTLEQTYLTLVGDAPPPTAAPGGDATSRQPTPAPPQEAEVWT